MELKFYTPDTVKGVRTGEAAIRINRKAAFTINSKAKEVIGLQDGDYVVLAEAEAEKEWYLIKSTQGFKLRDNSNKTTLAFNCSNLANIILDSRNLKDKSYSIKIATVPTDLGNDAIGWCLFTASAK